MKAAMNDERIEVLGQTEGVSTQCPVVLISADKPTHPLVPIVAELASYSGVRAVIIINDGSGPEFKGVFSQLSGI